MSQTILFSKTNFLNWIARQIKDDECVIMTDGLKEATASKHQYKASFLYSSDIFPSQDARNIMQSKGVALCIPKINSLSEQDQNEVISQPEIK